MPPIARVSTNQTRSSWWFEVNDHSRRLVEHLLTYSIGSKVGGASRIFITKYTGTGRWLHYESNSVADLLIMTYIFMGEGEEGEQSLSNQNWVRLPWTPTILSPKFVIGQHFLPSQLNKPSFFTAWSKNNKYVILNTLCTSKARAWTAPHCAIMCWAGEITNPILRMHRHL